jgi:hypothetical protein
MLETEIVRKRLIRQTLIFLSSQFLNFFPCSLLTFSSSVPILCLENLGPGVPQGYGAVENRCAGGGVSGIDAEIAESFELAAAGRGGFGQAGFELAVV